MHAHAVGREIFLVLLLVVGGCGGPDAPATSGQVPFSGTVTLDGEPVENAQVKFIPLSGESEPAVATTDASGKYELKSGHAGAAGAKPGEYKVVISRLVKPDGTVAVAGPDRSPMQLMVEDKATESIPPRYSEYQKSTLKATVPGGGGSQDFQLNSK
ncbi:MAG: carboxypeptidase regulatory-like domain-containing protein [Pirellulales bacterium]|nr:carboxypeptidase regulatory-like domain-containing protein [Pirellulales bacterium]